MAYSKEAAAAHAIQLVHVALQSGAIKLTGPATDKTGSSNRATYDAAYLTTLLQKLSEEIEKLGD